MAETQELIIQDQNWVQRASDFMPVFDIQLAINRKRAMRSFIAEILNEGGDYGVVPGTTKPTLLKPGAEKLASFFGLSPTFIYDKVIENWGEDGSEPLFFYRVKCRLVKNGKVIGEADAACSSWESKYRYRWVPEDQLGSRQKEGLRTRGGITTLVEPEFAVDKADTTGPYAKPQAHWDMFRAAIQEGRAKRVTKTAKTGKVMECWSISVNQIQYQIPNPDIFDQINTILKMSEKRALVAAVLIATNASDSFTQDLDEEVIEQHEEEPPKPEPQRQPRPSGVNAIRQAVKRSSAPAQEPPPEPDTPPWIEIEAPTPKAPPRPPTAPPVDPDDVAPKPAEQLKRLMQAKERLLEAIGKKRGESVYQAAVEKYGLNVKVTNENVERAIVALDLAAVPQVPA